MTSHDIAFLGGVACLSAIIGVVLGTVCRGRSVVTVICSGLTSLLLFAAIGGGDSALPKNGHGSIP